MPRAVSTLLSQFLFLVYTKVLDLVANGTTLPVANGPKHFNIMFKAIPITNAFGYI